VFAAHAQISDKSLDLTSVPRRYSEYDEMSQLPSGEPGMIANYQLLACCGYSIIWAAGEYCHAIRGDRDATFRWNGDHWVEL
jgi:hypothetical protein